MKFTTLAVAALLAAVSATAGVTYDFHSETSGMQQVTIDGKASVEGANVRMNVARGDGVMFKDGATMISRDGGKTLAIYDPNAKTYFEISLDQMMASVADVLKSSMVKIAFTHPSVTLKDGGDGGTIEGFPTQKAILDASVDINIDAMGQTMTSKMSMHSESWTTDKLAGTTPNFFQQRTLATGVDALDTLIAAQSKSLQGRFPLKQVTTVHVLQGGQDIATTTTATVTNVKQKALVAAVFAAPEGYTRVDNPLEAMEKRKM